MYFIGDLQYSAENAIVKYEAFEKPTEYMTSEIEELPFCRNQYHITMD